MTAWDAAVEVLRQRSGRTVDRCREAIEDLGRELREHELTPIA